jgi:hypothetical protein
MIRQVEYRCVVQRNNTQKDKYYPAIVQGTTNEQYPFQVPTCDLEIITNTSGGTSGYMSPIRADDIIRVQVSTKMNPLERTVWEDLFSGTVEEIEGTYGNKNTTSLHCVGHIQEAEWSDIEETKAWTSTTDAQAVFQYFLSTKSYKRRLAYDANYVRTGITFTNYSTTLNQNTLADVIADMEKYSGKTYRASAVPIYDAQGNLSNLYLGWKPLDTVVTDKYKVIEGTSRYINSTFASSIEDLITRLTVVGSTTNNYKATASNATAIAQYGKRSKTDTYSWITSTEGCTTIATNLLDALDDASVVGQATILGTPSAHPGDLVYCKSPSQEVNGAIIDQNMTVYRVSHRFGDTFTTSLNLGSIKKDAYDYIGQFSKEIKTCKKNIVKCT